MTSRASWLNGALVRENFRRFWPIMAGGLAFWLICGPIALAIGGYPFNYHFMRSILEHENPAPVMLNLALPIALAVACFGYLHRTNAAGVMHAMPFSRRSLFVSNYVSGLLLAILPAAVISVILLLMRGGVEVLAYEHAPFGITAVQVLRFLLEEIVVISFVYSISVFAAVISGLPVIHALTAGALNFICPVVFLLLVEYMDIYEYGFTWGSMLEDFAAKMNPWIQVLAGDGLSAKQVAIYLLIALAVTICAYGLYRVRALERAGESYVFRAAKYIIGFLMVFACSSLTGFVFHGELGVGAYLLGFVFGYVISQMIVNKSTKIFTKDCLVSGLVYLLVIAAVVCVFRLDLVGYQKRVPNPSKVQSVSIDSDRFDIGLDGRTDLIADPENIERVIAFHKEIVADPANYQDTWSGYYTTSSMYYDSRDWEDALQRPIRFEIDYHLTNGRTMSRDYWIPAVMLKDSAEMRDVWNSEENKSGGLYAVLSGMSALNTQITMEGYNLDMVMNLENDWVDFSQDALNMGSFRLAQKEILLDALMEDLRVYDYERLFRLSDAEPTIYLHLDCRTPAASDAPEEYLGGNAWSYYDYDDYGNATYRHTMLDLNINKDYVHAMNALKQIAVSDDLKQAVESILR